MTTSEVYAKELGKCPFCEGDIAASLKPNGDLDGVLHSTPMCERYMREEPDAFLKSVNQELGEISTEMRAGDCPGCDRVLSFKIIHYTMGLDIEAGHQDPSCEWYKAQPNSMAVARGCGLVANN